MPGKLQAAVELLLNDKFSIGMRSAGKATGEFKAKAVAAAQGIDQAFSAVGAKIASLGVTIGAAALIKTSIEYEDSIIRIGTNAGMSGAEVNQFRRELLAVAQDAKVPVQELVKFSQTVTDNSIGLDVASESMRFMADAIQGLGLSGNEAADVFSVLYRKCGDIDTVKEKFNNLAEIDNRLQGMGLAEFAKRLPQLMEASEGSIDSIEDLYTSILTLNNGASNNKAITQYTAAMQDFANNRDEIRKHVHFDVKNENGELKSFTEIMNALVDKSKEVGGFDRFKEAFNFGDNTILALKQFNNYSAETIAKVQDLGDTSNAVSGRAEQNAGSLASNLVSLQDNVLKLADAALTKPIENLAKLLDKHPTGMERAIQGVGVALLALSAMKAFSTVVTFFANIKGMRGGMGKMGGMAGGMGMPVYVTNWGGGMPGPGMAPRGTPPTGGTPPPMGAPSSRGTPSSRGVPSTRGTPPVRGTPFARYAPLAKSAPLAMGGRFLAGAGRFLGIAGMALPFVFHEINLLRRLKSINEQKDQLQREGKRGMSRAQAQIPVVNLPPQITQTGSNITPQKVDLGHADINLNVSLTDDRSTVSVDVRNNTIPANYNTGSLAMKRRYGL